MTPYIYPGLSKTSTLEKIMYDVSLKTRVSIKDIKSKNRTQHKYFARAIFSYIAYSTGKWSLNEIGMEINKTHGSILNQIKTIRERKYNIELLNFIKKHNIQL